MYKDKSKQQAANRESAKRYRTKGMTAEGMTPEGMTGQGMTGMADLSPDMAHLLDKLTDPVWREKYTRICASLGRYQEHVSLGIFNMELVCDLLDVTG